jgi:hypothetical protein
MSRDITLPLIYLRQTYHETLFSLLNILFIAHALPPTSFTGYHYHCLPSLKRHCLLTPRDDAYYAIFQEHDEL